MFEQVFARYVRELVGNWLGALVGPGVGNGGPVGWELRLRVGESGEDVLVAWIDIEL